ncbi:MAG: hypothetical protein COB59_01950 [Rhodospirillaceae bacterium]|nr:MAG: hypothetical protein COB59_01950 [Rhodospirillaceae bacterium]
MEISAATSSIQDQYKNLLSRLKSGDTDYQEAITQHREMFPETRGVMAIGVGKGGGNFIRANVPADVMEGLIVPPVKSDYMSAAKTYEHGGGSSTGRTGEEPDLANVVMDELSIVLPLRLQEFVEPFNTQAHDYLASYANDHKTEWIAMAKDLGIGTEGGNYLLHFFRQSSRTDIDISMGVPKSDAEMIFRQIASAEDIQKFETRMAPAQKEVEKNITDFAIDLLQFSNDRLAEFEPYLEALNEAGLTSNDMAGVLMTKDKDGNYQASIALGDERNSKREAIESFVNGNSGVRALYDKTLDRQYSSYSSTTS